MDSNKRSIAKAISWRILATAITFVLAWVITGRGDFAVVIGISDTCLKIFIYFAHERMWNRIRYGRKTDQPEYHI